MDYSTNMDIRATAEYRRWFEALNDNLAKARIEARIRRLTLGNAGDSAPVGSGVSELRLHHGAGWRVYYTQHGNTLTILLAGGTKKTQQKDIELALSLARNL
jgi:putative addiction module killer protein